MKQSVYDFTTIKAVIGLGNPGHKYELTRHNVGFLVLDELAERYGGLWHEKKNANRAQIQVSCGDQFHSVLLIKPTMFMNNSGKVWDWLAKKGVQSGQVVVVHDELEKTFGTMQVRFAGSARGHNGLRSLMNVMGADFWRVRVGIGRPEEKREVGGYVLQRFTPHELEQLPDILVQAADNIVCCGK